LNNPANRQTDKNRQTDTGGNITSMAEVKNKILLLKYGMVWYSRV